MRGCAVFSVSLFLLCGLSTAREPWTSSRVVGSPEPPKPYAVKRIYPQLEFNQPVELLPLGDTGKMLLLEVNGAVYTFDDSPHCDQADLAIDLAPLTEDFSRAFGIGVHPKFSENREVFICYSRNPVARPDGSRLSRFKMTESNPPRIDPDSEEVLLTWASGGHNGCAIRFDKDGFLYFSAGDGARPYPPDEYDVSQDLSDLRATICRIDVDRRDPGKAYAVPPDNPFVDLDGARPEIWSYGFRNPWRFTIDAQSGAIFCGDVGWELWELVHLVQRGGNHGWSIFEGPQPIRGDIQPGPTPIIKPLVAYPHTEGLSVTGGIVYHGSELPELRNAFLYGDYVTGLVWGVRERDGQANWNELLAETGLKIITFAESRAGEPLIMSYDGGIYELIKNPLAGQPTDFPRRLSETGLFRSTATLEPATGVLPYEIKAHAWQDGARSQFVVGVPGSETITTGPQQRNWKYPVGTVFAKTLTRDVIDSATGSALPQRIETQVLHFDGTAWQPYSYAWNANQTDAALVPADGRTSEFQVAAADGTQQKLAWRFHSRAECRACHSNQAGGAVAFTFANLALNGDPRNSRRGQVAKLVDLQILDRLPPSNWNLGLMVDPTDTSADLEQRARSYLAVNCAHCHCRGGGGTVALDLSLSNATEDIYALNFPATQGAFEIPGAKVITPGDPYRSVLFYRMATSGTGHMPKLWTRDNDRVGLELIHDWIASLAPGVGSDHTTSAAAVAIVRVPQALQQFHQYLQESPVDETVRQQATAAFESADAVTRGLFERFLPADQRIERLGNDIDPGKILALDGDAERGRAQFLNSPTLQCRNCHRLNGRGVAVGPDLDGLGAKRSRAELLESLLDPAKAIEPQYTHYALVTLDGQIVSGLKIEQTPQQVVLRSADGKDHHIAAEDIEHLSAQSTSLMPVGLAAEMTAEELADLLAFLSSLKSTP